MNNLQPTVVMEFDAQTRDNYLKASNAYFEDRQKRWTEAVMGIAEGDSWFDYLPAWLENPFQGDLLGHLNTTGKYNIYRVSEAGDTLENMVYGTEYQESGWTPKPPQLLETLEFIKTQNPQFLLFSGGGNDIAGEELESYLNHQGSGLSILREDYLDYMFKKVFKKSFEDLIAQVKGVSPNIQIFLHGYAYPIPDGRGVFRIVPGWQFIGPWLRPALLKKRILEMSQMRRVVNLLIDKLNEILAEIASHTDRVHYIDLRGQIIDSDWANELHLTSAGWGKVAKIFDERLSAVLKS